MANRIAPDGGYNYGNKKQWRRRVWASARRFLNGHVADATVLLMPSLEGDEIEVAKSNGFRESNISILDSNPAIVARLKRKYPRVTAYGVEAKRVFPRAAKSGAIFDVVNLDFTGCLSLELLETLSILTESRAIAPRALVIVTCQRGREHGHVNALLDRMSSTCTELVGVLVSRQHVGECIDLDTEAGRDWARVNLMRWAFGLSGATVHTNSLWSYKSSAGNLTMLVASFVIERANKKAA